MMEVRMQKRHIISSLVTLILLTITLSAAYGYTIKTVHRSPDQPVYFGVRDLDSALKESKSGDYVTITVDYTRDDKNSYTRAEKQAKKLLADKPESFVIARRYNEISILGSDATGAMYGCFELAERLANHGENALFISKPISRSPEIEFRAINPFLSLPYEIEEEDWWFLQEDYWEGYLDQLARARFNWIDLHGMYEIKSTEFPNLYPYFIKSEKFPDVGVPPETADRNLAMLKKVMKMAEARGIHFALMSYSTSWHGQGMRNHTSELNEANVAEYTREVVTKIINECPELDMIGFRIGESGRSGSFFTKSYIPAIKDADRRIDMYTRTWLTEKEPILDLGREFPGRFFIEIKYNGEQFGPPYIISGGRTLNRHSYFYQNYYTYPRNYKIIYQLRTNGSHRTFYWGNPIIASRASYCTKEVGSVGLCIEPINSYYPKYDFRHKPDSPHRWFKYQYERDWFFYEVWGRTAYNPALAYDDDVWKGMFARRIGEDSAGDIYNSLKWASKIVPDILTAWTIHPDHRYHAPELENGELRAWSEGMPFDIQNVQPPQEYAHRLLTGEKTARKSPMDMADLIEQSVKQTRYYLDLARKNEKDPSAYFNDMAYELEMLAYLGEHAAHKLRAATYFELMKASKDLTLEEKVRDELDLAKAAWTRLAQMGDAHYQPFVDTLRMWTEDFTWSGELEKFEKSYEQLNEALAQLKEEKANGIAPEISDETPGPVFISNITHNLVPAASPKTGKSLDNTKVLTVACKVESASPLEKVYLRVKPLPSERLWRNVEMTKRDGRYRASVNVYPEGLQWCIEAVNTDGGGALWPNFRRETPYEVIPAWNEPVPWGDNAEALAKIDEVEDFDEYSALFISTDAHSLNRAPKEVKDKIMSLVENGMNLFVSAQIMTPSLDENKPEYFDPSWLGGDIKMIREENTYHITLVGDHPIFKGLPETIHRRWVANNKIVSSDDSWTCLGDPCALAERRVGKGKILMFQSDARPWIFFPDMQLYMKNAVDYIKGDKDGPLLVLDWGDETGVAVLDKLGIDYIRLGMITNR